MFGYYRNGSEVSWCMIVAPRCIYVMQGLSPFPRSEPAANCMQYASHHMVSWSVVNHLGKLVSMAIGSDTEIKQYQVQKRFSLADT